jgi:hypothetical protein
VYVYLESLAGRVPEEVAATAIYVSKDTSKIRHKIHVPEEVAATAAGVELVQHALLWHLREVRVGGEHASV